MASIDWTVLGLGALIGVGCREELKSCGRVAATTAASLAATAAQAAKQVADETQNSGKSAEERLAEAKLRELDERIRLMTKDLYGDQNGQNTNG